MRGPLGSAPGIDLDGEVVALGLELEAQRRPDLRARGAGDDHARVGSEGRLTGIEEDVHLGAAARRDRHLGRGQRDAERWRGGAVLRGDRQRKRDG